MKCTHPVRISDKETAGSMMVPCGHCIACRLNYASMWSIRMMNESKMHDKSVFATLTYNDENLPEKGTLVKRDVQLFLKSLRRPHEAGKIRYYIAGEYGENYSRPHYHAILFGLGKDDQKEIEAAWEKGFVYVGNVTDESTSYVARYITKKLSGDKAGEYKKHGVIPEFSIMSRRPGIGSRFCDKFREELKNRKSVIVKGRQVGLPAYYKQKIFSTDKEKEEFRVYLEKYQREQFEKELDSLKKEGYIEYGKKIVQSRQGSENTLKARVNLKRRKSL